MKKFALSLIIASAAVFGVGTAVSAQYDTTTTAATTTAATTTTIAGGQSPATPTTTVAATVPGAGLPATGSSGMGTTTGIALGLLVVGLGLFVVTRMRRSQPDAA